MCLSGEGKGRKGGRGGSRESGERIGSGEWVGGTLYPRAATSEAHRDLHGHQCLHTLIAHVHDNRAAVASEQHELREVGQRMLAHSARRSGRGAHGVEADLVGVAE